MLDQRSFVLDVKHHDLTSVPNLTKRTNLEISVNYAPFFQYKQCINSANLIQKAQGVAQQREVPVGAGGQQVGLAHAHVRQVHVADHALDGVDEHLLEQHLLSSVR